MEVVTALIIPQFDTYPIGVHVQIELGQVHGSNLELPSVWEMFSDDGLNGCDNVIGHEWLRYPSLDEA